MPNIAFTIGCRVPGDPTLYEYAANSAEFTYVASAASIARAMFAHPQVKQGLTQIAFQFDQRTLSSKWFQDNISLAHQWVDYFIRRFLQAEFPRIVVDFSITNADCLGYHPRLPWDGRLEDFPLNRQGVHLNGARIRDMTTAGSGNTPQANRRFRDFQFAFATTFLHEAGPHLLISWLGGGRPFTPRSMSAPGFGTGAMGESGRYFESIIFGGTTEFYRDKDQDNAQAGMPYQLRSDGWAWKIKREVIDKVCLYDFLFPFDVVPPPVDPHTMESMGRFSTDPPPTGSHDQVLMAEQAEVEPQLRYLASVTVREADLRVVPYNPSTRLVAVA
ncbi:hypothetical protein ACJ73_03673 [Blastomyces percursus]|uniref:Uncharacterized protein n=1 Tax=Blastomyces percursus TaxID=1658174 RepID=A0A1J9Q8U9_9EURO|nr:hypothetical protein ACJ73_03673 [Blastomyces percursus]